MGITRNQKIYDPDVRRVPSSGRVRKPVPDQEPREAEAVLAALPWRRMTWRQGMKGALSAQFAMTRVRVGDGLVWANNRHLPSDEVWLVGEWRASGERKFYLSILQSQGDDGGGQYGFVLDRHGALALGRAVLAQDTAGACDVGSARGKDARTARGWSRTADLKPSPPTGSGRAA